MPGANGGTTPEELPSWPSAERTQAVERLLEGVLADRV